MVISEKKLERMVETVLGIIGLEYAPVDFSTMGFKILLEKPLKEKIVNKVGNKMSKIGWITTYVNNEPENGFASSITVIKIGE